MQNSPHLPKEGDAVSPDRAHSESVIRGRGKGSVAMRRSLRVLLVVGGIALFGAAPASAGLGLACPDPTTRPFAPWNDYAKYAFVPNGGFESGASGWTLTGGARVVPGNESFSVHSSRDRYSLSMPPGSTATTSPMCISLFSGKMRFFTANSGAPGSRIRVDVFYNGGLGRLLGGVGRLLGLSEYGYVAAGPTWQPSPEIGMLGGTLPLLTSSVQFRFTALDAGGEYRLDDVYLDPFLSR
jgi:hypothetical protein